MRRFHILLLVLPLAVSACAWKEYALNEGFIRGAPASKGWVRVSHPTLPIVFEVPENAGKRYSFAIVAFPRDRNGGAEKTYVFGVREVNRGLFTLYALEVSFYIVTEENDGVQPGDLKKLMTTRDNDEFWKGFVRRVFFDPLLPASLEGVGGVSIPGYSGRRFSYMAGGPEAIIHSRGGVTIIPLNDRSALAICGYFSSKIDLSEEREIYPRILQSVRISKPAGGAF